MITNGQARRIAASWQASRNAFSHLQHMGIVSVDLLPEIEEAKQQVAKNGRENYDEALGAPPGTTIAELDALKAWAEEQGVGKISDWGAWDDTPVEVPA